MNNSSINGFKKELVLGSFFIDGIIPTKTTLFLLNLSLLGKFKHTRQTTPIEIFSNDDKGKTNLH